MDDLIKDFLQESRENLDHLNQDFVKLEIDANDPGTAEEHLSNNTHYKGNVRVSGVHEAGSVDTR